MESAAHESVGASQEKRLLVLDDEPHICSALRRLFRRDGYVVRTTCDVEEALSIVESDSVDVIISDQRMPACKGTDFLKRVQRLRPATVRMILSGYSDVNDITEAMDGGAIYKFLTKPWDDALLRANVREAFARVHALRDAEANSLIDPVTGLASLYCLRRIGADMEQETRKRGSEVCLVAARVDQFADLLVAYGEGAGNELLRAVASAFTSRLGTDWDIARSDRHGLLLLGRTEDPLERFADLRRRLQNLVVTPNCAGGEPLRLTFSLGCVASGTSSPGFDRLLEQAQAAVISASRQGGNRMIMLDKAERRTSRRRLVLDRDLAEAVERGAFLVLYQPQVALESGHVVGCEALIRWPHPELGFVSPMEFLPIAERLGLMSKVGAFVLHTAVRQARAWLVAGFDPGQISVNVAPVQLQDPAFAQYVAEVLRDADLPPERLVLEITENAAVDFTSEVSVCLDALARLGVALAIDDFGTGYANLRVLSELPIAKLKIDRSLVPGPDKSERALRLFENVVSMAGSLGFEIIAEGVETAQELAIVHGAGCKHIQGYFFSPPIKAEEIEQMLPK